MILNSLNKILNIITVIYFLDLPKIDKMIKDLTVNLQSASWKIESLNHQIDKLQQVYVILTYICIKSYICK